MVYNPAGDMHTQDIKRGPRSPSDPPDKPEGGSAVGVDTTMRRARKHLKNPAALRSFPQIRCRDPVIQLAMSDEKSVNGPQSNPRLAKRLLPDADSHILTDPEYLATTVDSETAKRMAELGKSGYERYKTDLKRKYETKQIPSTSETTTADRDWVESKSKSLRVGRFTPAEDEKLLGSIKAYFHSQGMNDEEGWYHLMHGIKGNTGSRSPWLAICSSIPNRHIESCIVRAQTRLYPWPSKGRWTDHEKARLVQVVEETLSSSSIYWPHVSQVIGRHHKHCRDMYTYIKSTNKLDYYLEMASKAGGDGLEPQIPAKRRGGVVWTPELDAEILRLVRASTGVRWPLKSVPWTYISQSLKDVSPQQCRTRYFQSLFSTSGPMNPSSNLFRRHIIRHIYMILTTIRSDICWEEIDWDYAPPFWPTMVCSTVARSLLMGYAGLTMKRDWKTLTGDSDRWKNIVKTLYTQMRCPEYEAEDLKLIQIATEMFRKSQIGDTRVDDKGWLEPLDNDATATRRKMINRRTVEKQKKNSGVNEFISKTLEEVLSQTPEETSAISKAPTEGSEGPTDGMPAMTPISQMNFNLFGI